MIINIVGGDYGGSINFVDENNVLVGYSTDQSCCENASWEIVNESGRILYTSNTEDEISHDCLSEINDYLKPYRFHPSAVEEHEKGLAFPLSVKKKNKACIIADPKISEMDDKDEFKHTDDGGDCWVSFGLVKLNDEEPSLLLILRNNHNGYYSHGFEVKVGGKDIWGGAL